MELVPIKVKIGLRANGHADHPDWRQLPLAQREDPASHMFHGWKYDKTSGHAEHTADSPIGMQWGALLVTQEFAVEAIAKFPAIVTKMTEVEFEAFWNDKAHGHMPAERVDESVLQGLKVERDLRVDLGLDTTAIDAQILRALNVDDPEPGKRRNHMKKWRDAKVRLDVTIRNG